MLNPRTNSVIGPVKARSSQCALTFALHGGHARVGNDGRLRELLRRLLLLFALLAVRLVAAARAGSTRCARIWRDSNPS